MCLVVSLGFFKDSLAGVAEAEGLDLGFFTFGVSSIGLEAIGLTFRPDSVSESVSDPDLLSEEED